MNRGRQVNNSTGYKGVYLEHKKYPLARVFANGRIVGVKRCKTITEAAIAYNEMALKYHGEFAKLNIIRDIL
jgi:hypothetical protein